MINKFDNYLKFGKVKRKTIDPEESKSLLKKAGNRVRYVKSKKVTEENAPFVLEDAYEAIRESAQAVMSLKGFKPYSHEATIAFIKDFYNDEFSEGDISNFDRFRQLRNDSIYKAISVNKDDAKKSVQFSLEFIKKVKKILSEK